MKISVEAPLSTTFTARALPNATIFSGRYKDELVIGMKSVNGDKIVWVTEDGKVNSADSTDNCLFIGVTFNVKIEP